MKDGMCPVCHLEHTIMVQREANAPLVEVPAPLYQISYPGKPEYLPPRCSDCFDKIMERRAKKRLK